MVFLMVVLLTLISCAKDTDRDSSETEEEAVQETAEDYNPEVVDDLTSDFEEMEW